MQQMGAISHCYTQTFFPTTFRSLFLRWLLPLMVSLPPPPVASLRLRVLTFGALPLLGRLLLPHEVGHGVSFSLLLPQHLIQVLVIDVPRQGFLHFLHCIFHILLLLPALCQAGKDTGCTSRGGRRQCHHSQNHCTK